MTGRSLRVLPLATLGLLLALPTAPAHAQSGGSGCPPPSAIEENDQILFGRTWLPMRIGIDVAKATCRVHDFMVDFFKREPDPDKASLDDYIEASKPDDGNGGDLKYQAKMRDMPSPTKNPGWNPNPATSIVVLPPNTSGGVPVLFQANAPGGPTPTTVADIQGNGTLLSTEGMKRGTFEKGKLNGVGEEIDPNGTWRSGTYESGRNMGQVWEVRKVAGKTYLASGSVLNGKLDGMIERIFADGSTQFEDWEGGKLMQVGVRAPKGQSAMAPQARYKPVEEAELDDAYKKIGPRPKIAPGTTFDPARTVGKGASAGTLAAALKDYRQTCSAEIAAWVASWPRYGNYKPDGSVSDRIDTEYTDNLIRYPNIAALRAHLGGEANAYPERGKVNECAIRVAIRHAASTEKAVKTSDPALKVADSHPWVAGIMKAMPNTVGYRAGLPLNAMAKVVNQCSPFFDPSFQYWQTKNPGISKDGWNGDMAGLIIMVFEWDSKYLQNFVAQTDQSDARNILPCFAANLAALK